jgi:hypothetical protein
VCIGDIEKAWSTEGTVLPACLPVSSCCEQLFRLLGDGWVTRLLQFMFTNESLASHVWLTAMLYDERGFICLCGYLLYINPRPYYSVSIITSVLRSPVTWVKPFRFDESAIYHWNL